MDAFLEALAPHLLELIAAIATAILAWAAAKARARWGIEIEARHREALHSALMTGARHALASRLAGQAAVEATLDYVHASVPDARAALKPDPDHLVDMAEATLGTGEAHVIDPTGDRLS
jgi:hypothetical protein